MLADWKDAFTLSDEFAWTGGFETAHAPRIRSLVKLKTYLDQAQVKVCLLKPYFEQPDYPLVESRDLLPSFEGDAWEFKELPGFSMVALERPLSPFEEVFQYDGLTPAPADRPNVAEGVCPIDGGQGVENLAILQNRLPKRLQEHFRVNCGEADPADLAAYPKLLPFLVQMDRAQVMALGQDGLFNLAGVFASFPSDLDAEIKRFGVKIGVFEPGNNALYLRRRAFVYQFLMELYGFPVVSERRTSAALFSRRLFKMGERFLIRVLGQSDRVITSFYAHPQAKLYPRVEKIALVRVEKEQTEVINRLKEGGWFVDEERRVVILRVRYRQHKYDPNNVRRDRALSVDSQQVVHPLTGEELDTVNIIKDVSNMFLRLNDIVRGEYTGRTVFKRHEVVENTDTHDKRLKFLYSWISKHQRRIVSYSDDFYGNVSAVLDNYLLNPDNYEVFQQMRELHQEVWLKYSYIQQARTVRKLEEVYLGFAGERMGYAAKLKQAVELMHDLKFEIVNYFDDLVLNAIMLCKQMTIDSYIRRAYVDKADEKLTDYGREVKRQHRRLSNLLDEFQTVRKSRSEQLLKTA